MSDYEGMTNADVMSESEMREYDRDAELRLDAADEERALAAEQEQPADADDPDDCGGEFIDGTWYGCGSCQVCLSTTDDDSDEDDG